MAQSELGERDPSGFWVNQSPPIRPRNAPISEVGILGWLRANLFSNIWNTLLTILAVALIWWVGSAVLRWAFTEAFWEPAWINRKLFTVYTYPWERIWQPGAALAMVCLLFGLSAGRWGSFIRSIAVGITAIVLAFAVLPVDPVARTILLTSGGLLIVGYLVARTIKVPGSWLITGWVLALPISVWLIRGAITLPVVGTVFTMSGGVVSYSLVGGLMLTLLLAVVGIFFSFPIGVLLALGRRSNLPVIKGACIAYIELIRGVPLVSLLFMAMIALPLLLPNTARAPENAVRAMVAISAFSAAYMAEVVRGGLQAIPKGQYEAADALGLGIVTKYTNIILPQALRAVIPAIVSNFISMMKDTSLVALVGLTELLGVAQVVIKQPEWVPIQGGIAREMYVFVAVVYFVLSYGLSFASRRLETQFGVGKR